MTKKAFTLIELLVVIAIIALLLSILIPSLKAVKEYASIVNCLANQKSLTMAYILYAADNDEKFCSGYVHNDVNGNDPDPPSWVMAPLQYGSLVFVGNGDSSQYLLNLTARMNGFREGAIWPYLESPKTFHCPGDRRSRKGGSGNYSTTVPLRYRQFYRSYDMPDFYAISANPNNNPEDSLANIKAGGSKLLFVESQRDRGFYNIDAWTYEPYSNSFWDPLGNYHNKGCTFSFVDGHADQYRWKDPRTMAFMSSRREAEKQGIVKRRPMSNNPDFQWLDAHYPAKTRWGP